MFSRTFKRGWGEVQRLSSAYSNTLKAQQKNVLVLVEEGGGFKERHPLLPLLVYPGHNVQACKEGPARGVSEVSVHKHPLEMHAHGQGVNAHNSPSLPLH